jgi:hypothetical protein
MLFSTRGAVGRRRVRCTRDLITTAGPQPGVTAGIDDRGSAVCADRRSSRANHLGEITWSDQHGDTKDTMERLMGFARVLVAARGSGCSLPFVSFVSFVFYAASH